MPREVKGVAGEANPPSARVFWVGTRSLPRLGPDTGEGVERVAARALPGSSSIGQGPVNPWDLWLPPSINLEVMTLDDLRVFVAVCRAGSLSSVARELGCTQSAVSQH